MSLDGFLRPRARRDLEIAAAWYEDRRESPGSEFLDEFPDCVDRIQGNPESYPIVDLQPVIKFA